MKQEEEEPYLIISYIIFSYIYIYILYIYKPDNIIIYIP